MARYFKKISQEQLKDKIDAAKEKRNFCSQYDWKTLTPQIEKDLDKCQFDCENVTEEGYCTFDNGFTFFALTCGGDWEFPVFIILYYSGKELRAYIPDKGNPWNKTTKMAYGNSYDYACIKGDIDDETPYDGLDLIKQYPELYVGKNPEDINSPDDPPDRDMLLIGDDIKSRILEKK